MVNWPVVEIILSYSSPFTCSVAMKALSACRSPETVEMIVPAVLALGVVRRSPRDAANVSRLLSMALLSPTRAESEAGGKETSTAAQKPWSPKDPPRLGVTTTALAREVLQCLARREVPDHLLLDSFVRPLVSLGLPASDIWYAVEAQVDRGPITGPNAMALVSLLHENMTAPHLPGEARTEVVPRLMKRLLDRLSILPQGLTADNVAEAALLILRPPLAVGNNGSGIGSMKPLPVLEVSAGGGGESSKRLTPELDFRGAVGLSMADLLKAGSRAIDEGRPLLRPSSLAQVLFLVPLLCPAVLLNDDRCCPICSPLLPPLKVASHLLMTTPDPPVTTESLNVLMALARRVIEGLRPVTGDTQEPDLQAPVRPSASRVALFREPSCDTPQSTAMAARLPRQSTGLPAYPDSELVELIRVFASLDPLGPLAVKLSMAAYEQPPLPPGQLSPLRDASPGFPPAPALGGSNSGRHRQGGGDAPLKDPVAVALNEFASCRQAILLAATEGLYSSALRHGYLSKDEGPQGHSDANPEQHLSSILMLMDVATALSTSPLPSRRAMSTVGGALLEALSSPAADIFKCLMATDQGNHAAPSLHPLEGKGKEQNNVEMHGLALARLSGAMDCWGLRPKLAGKACRGVLKHSAFINSLERWLMEPGSTDGKATNLKVLHLSMLRAHWMTRKASFKQRMEMRRHGGSVAQGSRASVAGPSRSCHQELHNLAGKAVRALGSESQSMALGQDLMGYYSQVLQLTTDARGGKGKYPQSSTMSSQFEGEGDSGSHLEGGEVDRPSGPKAALEDPLIAQLAATAGQDLHSWLLLAESAVCKGDDALIRCIAGDVPGALALLSSLRTVAQTAEANGEVAEFAPQVQEGEASFGVSLARLLQTLKSCIPLFSPRLAIHSLVSLSELESAGQVSAFRHGIAVTSSLLAEKLAPVASLLSRDDLLCVASALASLKHRSSGLQVPNLSDNMMDAEGSGNGKLHLSTSHGWPSASTSVAEVMRKLQLRLPVLSTWQLREAASCGEALQKWPSTCSIAASRELVSRVKLHAGADRRQAPQTKLTASVKKAACRSTVALLWALRRQGVADAALMVAAEAQLRHGWVSNVDAGSLRSALQSVKIDLERGVIRLLHENV